MIALYDSLARRRPAVLVAALAVAVTIGVTLQTVGEPLWSAIINSVLLLIVGLAILPLLMVRRDRSGVPLMRRGPDTFETLTNPAPTLLAASQTILWVGLILAEQIGDIVRGDEPWPGAVSIWLPLLVLLVVIWATALMPVNVRLTTGGVRARYAWGSAFVPWEALDEDDVAVGARRVWLSPARPGLIRRTGMRRGDSPEVRLVSAGPERLARIIRVYLADPAARAAIGTGAELARLLEATAYDPGPVAISPRRV